MKRYELTYIVTTGNMTRHDLNVWLKSMKANGIPLKFEAMMSEAGQTLTNGPHRLITAMLEETDTDKATVALVELANAPDTVKH